MCPTFLRSVSSTLYRHIESFLSPTRRRKVAVLDAAGKLGVPLALFLKLNPLVSDLALHDTRFIPGVADDVNHILTRPKVAGYMGDDEIGKALEGSDLVIIPDPGRHLTDDQYFIIKSLCVAVSKYCPNALVNMLGNSVNSTVPIAAEVFKKAGTYHPKKLFGVTTLDVIRARKFYAQKANVNVDDVNVPVVGGQDGITILPLFSQATPEANTPLSEEDIKVLTKRIQDGDLNLSTDSGVYSFSIMSLAYAGASFADSCLKGLNGVPDVVECSYVQSNVTELPYFASKVKLGRNGVEEIHGLGSLSDFEKEGLDNLKAELKSSINEGIKFASGI